MKGGQLATWVRSKRTAGVISITAGPDGQGVIINTLLGADRFYNNGYFGQNAVVANKGEWTPAN